MKHVPPAGLLPGVTTPLATPSNDRARGILSVRGDAANPSEILNELKRTFEAFKAEHTKELADLKKGMGDVVQSEKVERINTEIERLQKSVDDVNTLIAAQRAGAGSNAPVDPDKKAHAEAFERFFRKGAENGLRDMEVKAAVSTDSDPDGGFVVPDQMEQTIDRVLGTVSTIRSIASVMTISTQTYKKLVSQGGATAGWVGERQARDETNTPKLADLTFSAMELYANPAATQSALDDARIDIGQWLADEVSIAFSEMEGTAFFSGDGVNKPKGIDAYSKVANANYAWGKVGFVVSGVAAELSDGTHNGVDALIDLVMSVKQGYRTNARFLMNRKSQGDVRKLVDANGQYLWQPSVQSGQPASLLGYPVTDDDNVSDIGANAFPIWFGDFRRAYLIVDRAGIRVLRDPYTNKPHVQFYTTKRVGGGIQNFEAIKALKIST